MITENLSTLKIHKLTQAQYDRELEAGNIDENALYLTPDEENIVVVKTSRLTNVADLSRTEINQKLSEGKIVFVLETINNAIYTYSGQLYTGVNGGAATYYARFTKNNISETSATSNSLYIDDAKNVTYDTTTFSGVTSDIQTQLDSKQSTVTGGASTITSSNLTTDRALISNSSGKVAVSAVTSTELGYLDGVTSNIQTQLDSKVGKKVAGKYFTINESSVLASSGAEIFNDYVNNKATGVDSHAEGSNTTASGSGSHAEGNSSVASGNYSHAEGHQTTASGNYSHAEGQYTTASGSYSHAGGDHTTAQRYGQTSIGRYNVLDTDGAITGYSAKADALIIGNGSYSSRSNAFRVVFDGKAYGGTYSSSGADYAEYFEWADGNPDNEDRIGLFVTLTNGGYIKIAQPEDDILGVVSGNGSVIGDSYDDTWHGMWMRDVYGRLLYEDVEVEYEDENGEKYTVVEHRMKLNPDYNPDEEYIPRSERKEWDAIGMFGKLVLNDDGSCVVGSYCSCGANGIATSSETGYRVMARLDDSHVRILVK